MSKRKIPAPSVGVLSRLFPFLGTYAVLCQLTFILLYVCAAPADLSPDVLRHTVTPWLEYPMMSLVLVFGGTLLLDWAQEK